MTAFVKRKIKAGTVLVCGDGHYWPGVPAPAHDALVQRVYELVSVEELRGVIYNGDAIDGARISRHNRIGWEGRPKVHEELSESQRRLHEIEDAVDPEATGVWLDWPLGNHDSRYETFLSGAAPEYEGITGMHLKDHFPAWTPCWGVAINQDVFVKHRLKAGVHARWLNAKDAGVTVITGHTHRLGVTPVTDYGGTRWGCESGMLALPRGPQFAAYTEAGPVNWQMGWLELTFEAGKLLWPQVVHIRG